VRMLGRLSLDELCPPIDHGKTISRATDADPLCLRSKRSEVRILSGVPDLKDLGAAEFSAAPFSFLISVSFAHQLTRAGQRRCL
jgi:hypothetical protein